MTHPTCTSRPRRLLVGFLAISLVAACGGSGDAPPSATDPAQPATTAATTRAPAPSTGTAPSSTAPSSTAPSSTAPSSTAPAAVDDATVGTIEQMLAASLTDIPWNCCGADAPPTGAAVAIRVPGAPDLLVSTGADVDGSPFDPEAPFLAANLGRSLVQSVAYRLIDAGLLDPSATIDTWAPQMPDATTVTVQMLFDDSMGWGNFNDAGTGNVVADLSRVWTLAEVVDVAAGLQPSGGTGRDIATTVLGHILEQTTGSSVADLVTQYVTEPLELDGTTTDIAAPKQPGYQHGVFVLDGTVLDTASVPTDAYWSFYAAANNATSTLPDLLDLLDAWVTGELLGPDRAATPDKFQPDNGSPDASTTIIGDGIPVDGYCDPRADAELEYPCTPGDVGLDVMAVGRQPNGVGTTLFLWHFPATGISIAMHHNSQEWVSRVPLADLAIEIHDLVAAS